MAIRPSSLNLIADLEVNRYGSQYFDLEAAKI